MLFSIFFSGSKWYKLGLMEEDVDMSFGGDYYILFSLFMSSSCNWMEDMEGGILFLVKKIEMDKLLFNSLFF